MRRAPIRAVIPYIIVPVLLLSGPPLVSVLDASTVASSPSLRGSSKMKGDRERGRAIFNGKGFCFQCHGQDGDIDRRPVMDPEIARVIEQLNPKPADLRNPATLKSKNDAERFTTIREGHQETAMFPKKDFLSDQEIRDIVAYLATLRSKPATAGQKVP